MAIESSGERQKRIEDLQEGALFSGILAVKSVHTGTTRAGKPYLRLVLMDKSGELHCPVWENIGQAASFCISGAFLFCRGRIGLYGGQKQLQQEELAPVSEDEVDLALFQKETARDRSQMADDLLSIVASVKNAPLKRLLKKFFGSGSFWQQFQQAAAARGAHHSYVGGLLEHTLSCAYLAENLAKHYPGVNRDLLVAGALLHDIGKVREMAFQGVVVEYTTEGRLKGHLVLGSEMITAVAATIDGFPAELLEQLQHLVLSHHGRLDFGSPVLPMTPEAFLLSMLDDMDAKMNMIEQLREKMEPGHHSFTEYQRLLERYLYLSGYDEPVAEKGRHQPKSAASSSSPSGSQPLLWGDG